MSATAKIIKEQIQEIFSYQLKKATSIRILQNPGVTGRGKLSDIQAPDLNGFRETASVIIKVRKRQLVPTAGRLHLVSRSAMRRLTDEIQGTSNTSRCAKSAIGGVTPVFPLNLKKHSHLYECENTQF